MAAHGDDEMNGGDGRGRPDRRPRRRQPDRRRRRRHLLLPELSSSRRKKASGRDTILDFDRAEGDEIDLTAIDAKKGNGNQEFEFIGKKGFHDKKGELRYKVKDGDAYVEGDTDGNGKADFAIVIDGVSKLKEADFEL